MINDTSAFCLVQKPLITSNDVVRIENFRFMNETPGLLISFNSKGTKQWEEVTGNHVGDLFAFVLNDTLLSVGINISKISTGKAFFPLPKQSNAELQRIKANILKK